MAGGAQGLLGEDFSLTSALLIVITLVGMDIGISLLKQRSPQIDKIVDSAPRLVDRANCIKTGWPRRALTLKTSLRQRAKTQGLERLDQIKYAILEAACTSVIPQA